MATINLSNLEHVLVQKAASATDSYQMLVYSKALEQMRSGVVNTVNTYSELPLASDWVGYLYWVDDQQAIFYASDEYGWLQLGATQILNQLWTWGENGSGQLGTGTTVSRSSPGTTAGGTTWCQVSGGKYHTAAVKTDGTLWTWGFNSTGQLGDNSTVARSSPVTTAGGGTTWCQVSSGCQHTAAVKTDGTLWTWGYNGSGVLGDNTIVSRRSPVATAGGGTTWCQVSSGSLHTAAIKSNGTLWTWGRNDRGQLGTGTTVSRSSPGTTAGGGTTWCQVSSGSLHTAAVKTDGTLWTWGYNVAGQLGDNSTVARLSPVTTAGGGTTWCQVSGGIFHTAAVKTDGTLWTWGNNGQGILGDNSTVNRSSPGITAGGGTTWCQVSGGNLHTAAVKTDGTLWTWGSNGSGRLGTGTTVARASPGTTAGGGTDWCQVSSGNSHTAAISSLTIEPK